MKLRRRSFGVEFGYHLRRELDPDPISPRAGPRKPQARELRAAVCARTSSIYS